VLAHAGAADESLSVAMILAAAWIGWIGWQRLKGTGFPRLPRGGAYALFGVGVVLVIGAAWLPRALFPPTAPPPAAGGTRIPSTATLRFSEPREGDVVGGDQLEVVLDLRGGTVVPGTSTTLAPDEGHLHLRVDGQLVSMTCVWANATRAIVAEPSSSVGPSHGTSSFTGGSANDAKSRPGSASRAASSAAPGARSTRSSSASESAAPSCGATQPTTTSALPTSTPPNHLVRDAMVGRKANHMPIHAARRRVAKLSQ